MTEPGELLFGDQVFCTNPQSVGSQAVLGFQEAAAPRPLAWASRVVGVPRKGPTPVNVSDNLWGDPQAPAIHPGVVAPVYGSPPSDAYSGSSQMGRSTLYLREGQRVCNDPAVQPGLLSLRSSLFTCSPGPGPKQTLEKALAYAPVGRNTCWLAKLSLIPLGL
ncbi:hypothetical protein NDU88_003544 [Pleurodeles waltl]|uniref:Uncharacterized protein n=1 Tax=Pleurodeles waltl TaxID=8319 RepID=A0AAV7M945_PLEWA|nr:hypothetical protein NDU88_003544 [Pleurodeles waltl]